MVSGSVSPTSLCTITLTVGFGRSSVCELPPPPEYADMLLTELMLPRPLTGIDMLRTLSRMICRIVFKNALRKSQVLHDK